MGLHGDSESLMATHHQKSFPPALPREVFYFPALRHIEIIHIFASVMDLDKVKYWTELSDYDLDTADAMFQTGRWLYVGYMCHQVVEKISRHTGAARRLNLPHSLITC